MQLPTCYNVLMLDIPFGILDYTRFTYELLINMYTINNKNKYNTLYRILYTKSIHNIIYTYYQAERKTMLRHDAKHGN